MDRVTFQKVLDELVELFESSCTKLDLEQLVTFLIDKFTMRMRELQRREAGDTLDAPLNEADFEDMESDFKDLDSDEMFEHISLPVAMVANERIAHEERWNDAPCSEEEKKRIIIEAKKEIE